MIDSAKVLADLPAGLRDPLIKSYQEIAANYAEHRWEPSELNGGKLCEVVYTVIDGSLRGAFAAKPSKPRDMVKACRDLEGVPADPNRVGDRSLRVLIPRVLAPLYEIRNNRGVGHVGGDVDPNFLDATAVLSMASWVLAELVRIYHDVSTKEAQASVDALIERKHPTIWEVEGVKRILDAKMPARNQSLLFLHRTPAWVAAADLAKWIEYRNPHAFRSKVLRKLHSERLIEFDKSGDRARISPLGIKLVEEKILETR